MSGFSLHFLVAELFACVGAQPTGEPFAAQVGAANQHVRPVGDILAQGSDSTSLSRRADTYQAIVNHAPKSILDHWWNKMLWDPEPYVRGAVFDALLDNQLFEEAGEFRHRVGISAAEHCKYSLRLHRLKPVVDVRPVEAVTLEDRFYCGLWLSERSNDSTLLHKTMEQGDFPLMMDFVVDLGLSGVDFNEGFTDLILLVEDPFQLPMASAWLQSHPQTAQIWWETELKSATIQRCEEAVDAFALFSSEQSLAFLERLSRLRSPCQDHASLRLMGLGLGEPGTAIDVLESDGSRGHQRLAIEGLEYWLQVNPPGRKQRKELMELMQIVSRREADGDMQSAAFMVLLQLDAPKYVMDKLPNSTWRVQLTQVIWYWELSEGGD